MIEPMFNPKTFQRDEHTEAKTRKPRPPDREGPLRRFLKAEQGTAKTAVEKELLAGLLSDVRNTLLTIG